MKPIPMLDKSLNSFLIVTIAILCLSTDFGVTDVVPATVFGDHMVLQQGVKLPIWGTADPGEKVSATIGTSSGEAVADTEGKWRLDLAPLPWGSAPMEMTITGKNSLKFQDVLVGDVWLCSGQSNMEFDMKRAHNAAEEIPKADYPQIRLCSVGKTLSIHPLQSVKAHWAICTPETVASFSAAGYFFGRELNKTLQRPIGLIESDWGGTPVEAWTSSERLRKLPFMEAPLKVVDDEIVNYPMALEKWPEINAKYTADRAKWEADVNAPYKEALKAYKIDDARAQNDGTARPQAPVIASPAPKRPIGPDGSSNQPTILFNGMIAPLIPYALTGVIWYQGEANVGHAEQYRELLGTLITDWRTRWAEGNFPFLVVQLANFMQRMDVPTDTMWARLREAQLQTLQLPNTGLAVIIDLGMASDIHPPDKLDVGLRLAQAAKHVAYRQDVVYSGPIYDSMKIEGNVIRLSFTNLGGGLTIGSAPWIAKSEPAPSTTELQGFAICGEDKKWVWANATIDGSTVVIRSDQIATPVAARYGWADNPEVNLYNKEGLPASPFRTDDWTYEPPPKTK